MLAEVTSTLYTVDVTQHKAGFIILGIVLMIVGALAIAHPAKATAIAVPFFGWILAIGGVLQGIASFFVGSWDGFFLLFFSAALAVVIGWLLVSKPRASAEVVTFLMAFYFMVSGILYIVVPPFAHVQNWGWFAVYGVINLLLGGWIFSLMPAASFIVIGLFLGIDILLYGLGLLGIGLSA